MATQQRDGATASNMNALYLAARILYYGGLASMFIGFGSCALSGNLDLAASGLVVGVVAVLAGFFLRLVHKMFSDDYLLTGALRSGARAAA